MARKRFLAGAVVLLWTACAGTSFAVDPITVEARFDQFCRGHFAAPAEPEMYQACGKDIRILDRGDWKYASENSAVVACETNLPAKTYVQYGFQPGVYIYQTPITDRNHFIHVHYLRHLTPNTTYHYRVVAMDELIRIVRSEDKTFSTRTLRDAVQLPRGVEGPPYVLDKPDTTYLVTQDITAPSTAFNIAADGVTLDLGGHTVVYDDVKAAPDPKRSERLYGLLASQGPCGIRTADGKKNMTLVNGTLRQGSGNGTSKPGGYYPIFMRRPNGGEVAGLTVIYSGSQVSGVIVNDASDAVSVHHNIIADRGTELYDRHRGVEAIVFGIDKTGRTARCHHNLIKRTRHIGIRATEKNEIFANEIYLDSYATNSYGVMYYSPRGSSDLSIHGNRIFGTGFHPIGIGSGEGWSDVKVYENYVHMLGTHEDWRWGGGEGGGDKDAANRTGIYPVNGIRLQKPKSNVRHYDNVVVVKGFGSGCYMRGLWLVPDNRASGVSFRNNRIKAQALDVVTKGYAVAACGAGAQAGSPRVTLEGNRIASNLTNVQFGDNYGHGGPYLFAGNTLVCIGALPGYQTIRMGWLGERKETYAHRFEDTTFEGGAGFDKVSFDGAEGLRYDFRVAWSLDIRTAPGAKVTIKDRGGRTLRLHKNTTDDKGRLVVTLTEYILSPRGKRTVTPHTVIVEKGGQTAKEQVTLSAPQVLEIGL